MEQAAITQEEYRKILVADDARHAAKFYQSGDRWCCSVCGEPAATTTVAHPIWDGPFDGAGRGKCDYRTVLSCPQCDGPRERWQSGTPIRIPAFPGESVRIMRRLAEQLNG